MKKLILTLALVICAFVYVDAQPRAVGANIGSSLNFSYQHGFGEYNFLDVNVDIPFFNGLGATVTYDWVDPFNAYVPWDYDGEWHWYLGVGAAGGCYGLFNPNHYNIGYMGVAGHVGIAYDFWFPLQLSLDYRPNIGVKFAVNATAFNTEGLYSGITLGVRYRF